jgi:Ca-activated chloride channel family protein
MIKSRKSLQIFTIGVGTKKGGTIPNLTYMGKKVHSSLDDSFLKALGERGGGRYFEGNSLDTLSVAKTIIDSMTTESPFLSSHEAKTSTYLSRQGDDFIYDRYYQYPLALAILLLASFLIFPENWKREKEE